MMLVHPSAKLDPFLLGKRRFAQIDSPAPCAAEPPPAALRVRAASPPSAPAHFHNTSRASSTSSGAVASNGCTGMDALGGECMVRGESSSTAATSRASSPPSTTEATGSFGSPCTEGDEGDNGGSQESTGSTTAGMCEALQDMLPTDSQSTTCCATCASGSSPDSTSLASSPLTLDFNPLPQSKPQQTQQQDALMSEAWKPPAAWTKPVVFTSLSNELLAAVQPANAPAVPSSAPPPAAIVSPFDFDSCFRTVRQLQNSIFGRTLLCEDLQSKRASTARPSSSEGYYVVVKESSSIKMEMKKSPNLGAAIVGEDVRKEARLMRYLGMQMSIGEYEGKLALPAPLVQLQSEHVDRLTCGLSAGFLVRHCDKSGALSSDVLEQLSLGARFIAPLHGEFEQLDPDDDPFSAPPATLHYLATGYAGGGDLFSLVVARGRLSEAEMRPKFRQLLQAVQYLHARGVAHLDISTENVCLTTEGEVRLIDFGLGIVHERSTAAPMGEQSVASVDPERRLQPSDQPPQQRTPSDCQCGACRSTVRLMQQRYDLQVNKAIQSHPTLAAAAAARAPDVATQQQPSGTSMQVNEGSALARPSMTQALSSRCRMLMRPICEERMRPGKPYTTAPEVADPARLCAPWDAYAADCFALGVLLFVCLTGKPPFERPCHTGSDVGLWWNWILSGKWAANAPRAGCHTEHLSLNAKKLIDACIKPQQLRPTVDELLAHPWMTEDN